MVRRAGRENVSRRVSAEFLPWCEAARKRADFPRIKNISERREIAGVPGAARGSFRRANRREATSHRLGDFEEQVCMIKIWQPRMRAEDPFRFRVCGVVKGRDWGNTGK